MDKRTDHVTAAFVNLAVNVGIAFGMAAGVRVLHKEGVSTAVTQRVLIDGGPRRSAISATPEQS